MTALPSTEDLARLAKEIDQDEWVVEENYPDEFYFSDGYLTSGPAILSKRHKTSAEAIALLPALIREVLDRREAEGWRDISTAPLTGERVLVWRPTRCGGKGHIGVAYWTSDEYAKNPRPFWSSVEGYIGKTEGRAHAPTHWRPLPAPPTTPTTEASHGE